MSDTSAKAAPVETYDDRPFNLANLPPEVTAPLAPFKGEVPPAPQWFNDALADAPERSFVESAGSKLEMLTWGARGRPGLLLVHGNSAHADWWSYIAPFLAQDYRVAAFSLAGMGESEWRQIYSYDLFPQDAAAICRAAGLHEGGRKAVYIGHSFGGAQVFYTAVRHPDQLHAALIIDTGFGGPPPAAVEERRRRLEHLRSLPVEQRPSRVYPTMAEALSRFRLMPPQPVENPFIADYIARNSLRRAKAWDGAEGWTWKFDPDMWDKSNRSPIEDLFTSAERPTPAVPAMHIMGGLSNIIERRKAGELPILPADMPEIQIPQAHHHIMIDQPLALVAAIRAALAAWRA